MKVKIWKILGLILTAIFVFSAISSVDAIGVTNTISVGSTPEGIAYDSAKGELFVANYGGTTVSVISDSTNAVIKTITVGTSPWGVAYDASKGEIFVSNWGSSSVSVISDTSNAVLTTIPVVTWSLGFSLRLSQGRDFRFQFRRQHCLSHIGY